MTKQSQELNKMSSHLDDLPSNFCLEFNSRRQESTENRGLIKNTNSNSVIRGRMSPPSRQMSSCSLDGDLKPNCTSHAADRHSEGFWSGESSLSSIDGNANQKRQDRSLEQINGRGEINVRSGESYDKAAAVEDHHLGGANGYSASVSPAFNADHPLFGIELENCSMETRWGSRRLFNIESPKNESHNLCPEMLELKRKMSVLQKTFRPSIGHFHVEDAYDYLAQTIQNMRFYDFLQLLLNDDSTKLIHEIEYHETVIKYIEKRLVLCDDKDCRLCGRQNRHFVEMPDDLQDTEPFQIVDAYNPTDSDEELFEIVPGGLYPKYVYNLEVPSTTIMEHPFGSTAENLVRFSDPVRVGRCLLFRSNLLAQRFERWEIEAAVMLFSPEQKQTMKDLASRAQNISSRVSDGLKMVPLYLRRHEPFECGLCYFEKPRTVELCPHLYFERERARVNCLDNFENLSRKLLELDLEMYRLAVRMSHNTATFWDFLEWEILGDKIIFVLPFVFGFYLIAFFVNLFLEGLCFTLKKKRPNPSQHTSKRKFV